MIKAEHNKGNIKMQIKGSVQDLAGDCCMIVRNCWESIAEQDKEEAEKFKFLFEKAAKEGVIFADEDEIAKKTKELMGKADTDKDAVKDLLKELKDALEELIDDDDDEDE